MFKLVCGSNPSVGHMRVFGCLAYAPTPKEKRHKWDLKSRRCIFVGYEESAKAYRLYDIADAKVVIGRNVTFDESTMGSQLLYDDDFDSDLVGALDDMVLNVPTPLKPPTAIVPARAHGPIS